MSYSDVHIHETDNRTVTITFGHHHTPETMTELPREYLASAMAAVTSDDLEQRRITFTKYTDCDADFRATA
ncbi:MAG TPA: hypothetical protein VLG09_02615 [Candidatus Saccharimonadales bacterium]|nr:hypothetical protein [Candidatus Saccharimonadales bacterium]